MLVYVLKILPPLLSAPPANEGAKPATKTLTFAVVPKLLDNPVFKTAKSGAEAAAADLGGIRIEWAAPVKADAAEQAALIDSLIARKVDGIALSCNDPQALKRVIDKAVDAGIPTITFDSDAPKSKRATFFGTDNYQGGLKAAELLGKEMAGKGSVALLTGVLGADNLEARIRGFKEGLKKFPGMKIITTVACNDDMAESVRQVKDVNRAHANLGGWFMVGGWPLFVAPPGGLAGVTPGKVKVVSFDTLEPQLRYVREGYVQALVGQKYYAWGYESVKILKGLRDGKTYPAFVDSGLDVVTRENVDAMAAKWKSGKF